MIYIDEIENKMSSKNNSDLPGFTVHRNKQINISLGGDSNSELLVKSPTR